MSVQFGRWNFDGKPVEPELIRRAAALTAKYGPGGETICGDVPIAMFFQPFQLTEDSPDEKQPLTNEAGVMLTWDGRLDNRDEVIHLLNLNASTRQSDARIVLNAYEKWDTACFGKLLGDWALVLWDPTEKVLLFAKDFAGTRHLFYMPEVGRITWCSVLDPLVLLAGRSFEINEQFIAGYLSPNYPPMHVTPYVGINAVPPSTFVKVKASRIFTQEYWRFDPSHRIQYRTDAEYEQHFRELFAEAVRRRLRSSFPVLAELSGGMDSTSIVCMADKIMDDGMAATPRLDTISYYDDDEPNWNERPYFSLVEKKRGHEGYHISVGGSQGALLPPDEDLFFPLPGYDQIGLAHSREFKHCLEATHSRVVLSGIGGDEFLGGVPTPISELQDLFVQLHGARFVRQLSRWSLQKRRPWTHLLFDTVEEFLPQPFRKLYKHPRIAPWLTYAFVQRNADVFWADACRTTLFGARPSFQSALTTLTHLRRQLSCSHPNPVANHCVSYPYFDRDLLVFLFAIPREQLVRPGQRRSLMRRALASLVPQEIFARKQKASVVRHPLALINTAMPNIEQLLESPLVVAYDWINPLVFGAKLASARQGEPDHMISAISTLKLELWLRNIVCNQRIVDNAGKPALFASRKDIHQLSPETLQNAEQVCATTNRT
jgi:asparagine synthase (glutamine-hydrolysing)